MDCPVLVIGRNKYLFIALNHIDDSALFGPSLSLSPPDKFRSEADSSSHQQESSSNIEWRAVGPWHLVDHPCDGRTHDGGQAPEHYQETKGGCQHLQAQDIHQDDGGEGDEGCDGDSEHQTDDDELSEALEEGEDEDGDS